MVADPYRALEEGGVVIAANARLARSLRFGFAARQRERRRQAWPTPAITTLDEWLAERFHLSQERLEGNALLLSEWQERAVWQELIEAAAGHHPLLDGAATAAAAAEAWELAHAWEVELGGGDWRQNDDTEAYQRWAHAFAGRCRDDAWITAAQLPAAVIAALARGCPAGPAQVWIGFDALTPAQQKLRAAVTAAGAAVCDAPPPARAARVGQIAAGDAESELRAAARWARARLAAGAAGTIGIVVPDLGAQRGAVERIFDDALHPERPPWDTAPRAFHISLGAPLGEHPAIAAALLILAAAMPEPALDWTTIEPLLLCPFLDGAAGEAAARGRLAMELRAAATTRMPLAHLAGTARVGRCPRLRAVLRRLAAAWPGGGRSHAQWSVRFEAALGSAGWPGNAPDSGVYQAQRAWQSLLEEFARLDQVSGRLEAAAALARLRTMAAGRIFQPEAGAAAVEILGMLEAAGQEFAALRVTGLSDACLPAAPHPHPFLPARLQRDRGMPHASAAIELAFARRALARLFASADEVVLSWPQTAGDLRLRPSPLLAEVAPMAEKWPEPARTRTAMETIGDTGGPAAAEAERGATARTLEDQSACAFRAFVRHRLGASAPEPATMGLSRMERGALLHRALEAFWRAHRDRDEPGSSLAWLRSLSTAERGDAVAAAVRAALDDAAAALLDRPGLAAVERERLTRLLESWLGLETQRADFRVLAVEDSREPEFAGLRLRLRADRVDEIVGHGQAVFDYKSGAAHADWDGARPGAPQLPLYAVTRAGEAPAAPVAAVALVQLKPGALKLLGAAAQPDLLPGVTASAPPLGERIAAWRAALERLAADYIAGAAGIDPARGGQVCRRCDLQCVCRIHEHALVPAGDDDGEEEASDG